MFKHEQGASAKVLRNSFKILKLMIFDNEFIFQYLF